MDKYVEGKTKITVLDNKMYSDNTTFIPAPKNQHLLYFIDKGSIKLRLKIVRKFIILLSEFL